MNQFLKHLQDFPKLKDVYQETLPLDRSFESIAAGFSKHKGTVLLLSGSGSDASRYNILGLDPWIEFISRKNDVKLSIRDSHHSLEMEPFSVLSEIINHFNLDGSNFELPIHAGLFGYFAYDLKDCIEKLPRTCLDTQLPDILLYAPSVVLIYDKHDEQASLLIPLFDNEQSDEFWIKNRKEYILDRLNNEPELNSFHVGPEGFQSSFTKQEYIDAVNKIIRYLKAGDIYQANLSQRFEANFKGDAYALFIDLFKRNPAAFFSYINAGDHHIVSTSPERFIQQKGRFVETRPIKGTIARGSDEKQDLKNKKKLSNSLKDEAELTMIVDLMRNDLSRACRHDSVIVREHKRVEPYENVYHLVSIVEGKLLKDKNSVDLIRATFPGGSITGCPKIRSMEIIDELEPVKRHVYTGSIGYISFHNTMDLSIAIRTATIANDRIWFSVGGGIVYDSDPQKEFQETLDKGKTLMESLNSSIKSSSCNDKRPSVKGWVNGKIIDQEKAVVPALSPGFQYGAGLFETIKWNNGKLYRLQEHIQRLNRSWEKLFLTPAPDITWQEIILNLVKENRFQDKSCAVKVMVANSGLEQENSYFLAVFIREYVHRLDILKKSGIDLITFPHPRSTPLADMKTMNYLFYDKAGQYARSKGGDEALILNPDHSVSETNTANILIMDDNEIIIPVSDHVLKGVTLDSVTTFFSKKGFKIIKEKLLKKDICGLSNVILTNALMGAVSVSSIDGNKIDHKSDWAAKINQVLFENSLTG